MTDSCFYVKDSADDINDVKNRLNDAGKKKTALEKDLNYAQNQLDNINTGKTSQSILPGCVLPGFIFLLITNFVQSDDISATINEAKRKAALANNSATVTMDRLNAINGELKNIKATPVDSNLNNVLNDVDETGRAALHCFGTLHSL